MNQVCWKNVVFIRQMFIVSSLQRPSCNVLINFVGYFIKYIACNLQKQWLLDVVINIYRWILPSLVIFVAVLSFNVFQNNNRLCGIPPENLIGMKNLSLNVKMYYRRCCIFIFLHDFGCLPTYITTLKMRNSTKDTLQNQAGGMPSRISCALKASRFDKRKHRIVGLAADEE